MSAPSTAYRCPECGGLILTKNEGKLWCLSFPTCQWFGSEADAAKAQPDPDNKPQPEDYRIMAEQEAQRHEAEHPSPHSSDSPAEGRSGGVEAWRELVRAGEDMISEGLLERLSKRNTGSTLCVKSRSLASALAAVDVAELERLVEAADTVWDDYSPTGWNEVPAHNAWKELAAALAPFRR